MNDLQFILLPLIDSIHVIHQYTNGNFFIEGKYMDEDSLLSMPDVPVVLVYKIAQTTFTMTRKVQLHFTDLLYLETAFFISYWENKKKHYYFSLNIVVKQKLKVMKVKT